MAETCPQQWHQDSPRNHGASWNWRQRWRDDPEQQPKTHGEGGVDDNRQDERSPVELFELSFGRAADSRNYHPGEQVDGKPETMTTDQAVSQGGNGHHQAAHDTTLDAGGNRVNPLGKPEPITRHSGTEMVHRAGPLGDRLGTQRRLDEWFVPVSSTGQQLPNPAKEAEDKQHRTDNGQGQARRQAGAQEGNSQSQHNRPGRRPRHFYALRTGWILRAR